MSVNIFRSDTKHNFAKSGKTMARKSTIGAFLLTTVYAIITTMYTDLTNIRFLAFSLPVICIVFFGLTYSKLKNELIYKLLNYFLISSSWIILFIAYEIHFKLEYVVVMMTVFILIFQVIPTPKKLIYYGASVFPVFMLFIVLSDVTIQLSSIILFLFVFSFVLSYIVTMQRKGLLRNLNSNSSILKSLINNTNDGFILVDYLSKEIKDVNRRTLDLFKIPKGESVFDNKLDDLFKDENYIKTIRSELRQQLSDKGFYSDEVLFKTYNGDTFWGHLFLSAFATSKSNYYLLQIKDIDVKKRFDEKITENYETYRFILDQLEEFIYLMSIDDNGQGKFEYLNPAIEKIFGVKKRDFITPEFQKEVASRYHPEDIDKMTAKKKEMMEKKEKTSFRYRMKPIGQEEYIWIEELVTPKIDADGSIEALLGIVRQVN